MRSADSNAPTETEKLELSLVDLLVILLRRKRTLILTPIVVVVLAVIMLLVKGRTYSAETSFRPQVSEGSSGRLAGIAAQFGLNLPGGTVGDPVRFYSELAKSRDLLRRVATAQYAIPDPEGGTDSVRGDFAKLSKVVGDGPADIERRTLAKLSGSIDVTTNREAGLVKIRVVTKWPELSTQIVRNILTEIDRSNRVLRQSQAGAERRFVEGRLDQARQELLDAEQAQERFLQQNRSYQSAPQLMLQYSRLQRKVDLQQQVFTGLAQAAEQAKIDEVRDTPQMTIIDRPEGSADRATSRSKSAIAWGIVGVMLGLVIAAVQELVERLRRQDPRGFGEVERLAREWIPFRKQSKS